MADVFLSATLTPDVKKALDKYLKNKEGVISARLRTQLKESIEYIRNKVAEYAPEQSGDLKSTILSLPISGLGNGLSFSFKDDRKLTLTLPLNRRRDQKILWVNRGTGIYGPNRRRIYPTSSEFLYFEVDGHLIRTRSIAGQRGQRFIQRALAVSKLIISTKISSALKG